MSLQGDYIPSVDLVIQREPSKDIDSYIHLGQGEHPEQE